MPHISEAAREELQIIAKHMIIGTVEAIIKHNTKAAELIRTGNYSKDDIASYNKKLLNLIYIIYPVLDVARRYLQVEHPEYLYILDFVERTYKEVVENVESNPEGK